VLIDTKPEAKDQEKDEPKRRSRHAWHAVTIVASGSACPAAINCKGKRFLSSEAPRLPLTECTAERCSCKYRHYEDRRNAPRRAEERGAAPSRVSTNRRAKRGRRAVD
jgi:hypothetical protein